MPRLRANGIEIEYEAFGEPGAPTLLLVMGLGGQLVHWPEPFCEALAERGLRVVRFDNRDAGRSTKLSEAGVPNVLELMQRAAGGESVSAPYTLDDMAEDTAELARGLDFESFHVAGASLGGMVAQTVALRRPERVRSLTSIMSTTGDRDLPGPRPEASRVLMQPPPATREAFTLQQVGNYKIVGGRLATDDARVAETAGRAWDRGFDADGVGRQLAAIVASGGRGKLLAQLSVPTLVIHGDEDPLVPLESGEATARAVPGATLRVVPGMGHSLPESAWPNLVDWIAGHVLAAEHAGGRS